MKKISQANLIIFFFVALFLVGSIYLFSIDQRYDSHKYAKGWWSLSFDNPKTNDLSFEIENFTSKSDFHWELLADNAQISEGDASIGHGKTQEIKIDADKAQSDKRMIIRISLGTDTKEIYKNISN